MLNRMMMMVVGRQTTTIRKNTKNPESYKKAVGKGKKEG